MEEEKTQTQRRSPCENGEKDETFPVISQKVPRAARGEARQGGSSSKA